MEIDVAEGAPIEIIDEDDDDDDEECLVTFGMADGERAADDDDDDGDVVIVNDAAEPAAAAADGDVVIVQNVVVIEDDEAAAAKQFSLTDFEKDAARRAFERTKAIMDKDAQGKNATSMRTDLPAVAKLSFLHDDSLEHRKRVKAHWGLKHTVRNQQVSNYYKAREDLIQSAKVGCATRLREVDPRKKHSKWRAIWDKVYEAIKDVVHNNQGRLSNCRIKRIARQKASEAELSEPDMKNLMLRLRVFKRRYKVSLHSAARVLKDPPDVMLAKTRAFHWVVAQVERRFPNIAVDDRCNTDELPQSPSGSMNQTTKIAFLGHEKRGPTNDPQRAVQHTLADETYRIGTFMPICGPERHDQPFAFMLFRGGVANLEHEKAHYHDKVAVRFSESGSVDERFVLDHFLPLWRQLEGPRKRLRMLFMDHHTAHFTEDVMKQFEEARTLVIKIPKSMTSVLQMLDVYFFHWLRRTHAELVDQFDEQFPGKQCNASEKRIYTQRFSAEAFLHVTKQARHRSYMEALGYFHPTTENVRLRGMPDYRYDPNWEPSTDVQQSTCAWLDRVALVWEATQHEVAIAPTIAMSQPKLVVAKPKPKTQAEKDSASVKRKNKAFETAAVGTRSLMAFVRPTPVKRAREDDGDTQAESQAA
jgi:hypothetical protein